jgi:RND family efflux transporter MFP subunit
VTDEPEQRGTENSAQDVLTAALAEVTVCETPNQVTGWVTRWTAELAEADAALLWTPDPPHPAFVCTGASGEGANRRLRTSAPRETGLVHDVIRDRTPFAFGHSDILASDDPLLSPVPKDAAASIVIPMISDKEVAGILVLFFRRDVDADAVLASVSFFVEHAAPALLRTLRSGQKTAGLLHAIERLTNLYDLSKAFGSTIEWDELTAVIARKAVDFASGEVASLWVFEGDEGEISLSATEVNENYDVENPPEAVGASIVGELIAGGDAIVENGVQDDHPLHSEGVRSVLGIPLYEDDAPVGALVIANKRGRRPAFDDADVALLTDLGHQAVRALRNARRYEAEKKVEELDALLAVSREITATLDLDRVMGTIVNSTAALIEYDRCSVAILRGGKLRLGAVSGMSEVNRTDPTVRRTEELLEWVFYAGHDVSVRQNEDGSIDAERPETREKFRAFFQESGMRFFHGVILQDEEGKLGVLGFESSQAVSFDDETRDLVQIIVNQATVAMRNAQLYQQVPLAGFWKPLLEKRRKLMAIPGSKRRAWAIGLGVAALVLIAVPWRIGVDGPARILPDRRGEVTTPVAGVVASVRRHEGDFVRKDDVIATLHAESASADVAQAQSDLDLAESEMARARAAADPAALYQAQARHDEASARLLAADKRLGATDLRAPISGVLVTPHLAEKQGTLLAEGASFCVVADVSTVIAEVAIPEKDASLLSPGEPVRIKLNSYPTRVFHGSVSRVAPEIHEDAGQRFVVAESRVSNPDGLIRPGMLGKGKIATEKTDLARAIFRKPLRSLWSRIWPLLP